MDGDMHLRWIQIISDSNVINGQDLNFRDMVGWVIILPKRCTHARCGALCTAASTLAIKDR